VFELGLPAPREVLRVAFGREADGVPEAHGLLHAELVLESPQRRVSVQRPIAPRRAGQPVLKKHPDNRHHREPAVGELRVQPLLAVVWVLEHGRGDADRVGTEEATAVVAWFVVLLIHVKDDLV